MPTYWRYWGKAAQSDRPKAILIHCMLAHSGVWDGVAHGLADRLSLQACDLPGHGQSPDWDPHTDFHDAATQMAAAALSGPAHLIGHSFGATVALRLALEHPGKTRSLTLIEPVLFAAAKAENAPEYAAHEASLPPFIAAMRHHEYQRAAQIFTDTWGTGQAWDDLPAAQRAYISARMPLVAATTPAVYDDRAGLLAPGRLERLSCPVLLLGGAKSPPIIAAIERALAGRIAPAVRVTIAGAGHMAPLTHAHVVGREIAGFLSL